MSFERRISSLPLYTRNRHIVSASGNRLASKMTHLRLKQNMKGK